MAAQRKKKKIVKYRRLPGFNIGTIMFGIIFIYMIVCMVMYLTSKKVTAYEVTAGPLSGNYRFTALALKSEQIESASQSGTIEYYAREGAKVGSGGNVYSLNEGSVAMADSTGSDASGTELDAKSLSKVRSSMSSYASNYSNSAFQNVYNFKADIESSILELSNEAVIRQMETAGGTGLVNFCTAPTDGLVVYSIDNYENLTIDDVTLDSFEQKNYKKENLRLNRQVSTGDPVYKLITDESWSLVIPLDQRLAAELAEKSTVRFRFLKDGTTFNAGFSIVQNNGTYFGKLDISNSLSRFASDRFVEIELKLNRQSGLKIPNTAIAEKVFYKIPKEFVTVNEDNPSEVGILKETYARDGSASTKYVMATVYDKTDTYYLVDSSQFKEGEYVLLKDSTKRYQISETETLQGVYNINKGYAVFREITVLDENEEYCIVEEGSSYGLAQYDHIALDASDVKDEDIVY